METNRKHDAVVGLTVPDPPPIGRPFERDLPAGAWAFPAPPETVACGALVVDRLERRAVLAGSDLHLTDREFALLLFLVDRTNRAVRRSDLLSSIWTLPVDYGSNVLDVYIGRLRSRFGSHAAMIETVRGFGYRLRPPQDAPLAVAR
jgi:two-component system, OmpR family, response regulator TctD